MELMKVYRIFFLIFNLRKITFCKISKQKKALTPTKVSSLNSQNTKHKLSAGKQDNQGISSLNIWLLYHIHNTNSSPNER